MAAFARHLVWAMRMSTDALASTMRSILANCSALKGGLSLRCSLAIREDHDRLRRGKKRKIGGLATSAHDADP